MPEEVHLPDEPAVDADDERQHAGRPAPRGRSGARAARNRSPAASPSGAVASHGPSHWRLAARSASHSRRSRRRSAAEQRSRSPAGVAPWSVDGPAATISGRRPRICESAWATTGSSTASPSRTPPVDPGRLTTRVGRRRPATPRDSMAVGTPAATPAARIASAMPGTSRSSTARVASGVPSVGDSPVPPVVSTTAGAGLQRGAQRRRAPRGRPARRRGPSTSNPHSRSASTISGPARSG